MQPVVQSLAGWQAVRGKVLQWEPPREVLEGLSLGTSVNETTGTAAIAGKIGTGAITVADIGITTAAADKELVLATGAKSRLDTQQVSVPRCRTSGPPIDLAASRSWQSSLSETYI